MVLYWFLITLHLCFVIEPKNKTGEKDHYFKVIQTHNFPSMCIVLFVRVIRNLKENESGQLDFINYSERETDTCCHEQIFMSFKSFFNNLLNVFQFKVYT